MEIVPEGRGQNQVGLRCMRYPLREKEGPEVLPYKIVFFLYQNQVFNPEPF